MSLKAKIFYIYGRFVNNGKLFGSILGMLELSYRIQTSYVDFCNKRGNYTDNHYQKVSMSILKFMILVFLSSFYSKIFRFLNIAS